MQIHESTICETEQYEQYKMFGELITANLYRYPEFAESVSAINYYEETMPEVTIPLDKNKSVSQNAQIYFKKYRKNKSAYENAVKYGSECRAELEYLESTAVMLENDTDFDEIEEVRKELIEQGYIKPESAGKHTKRQREDVFVARSPQEYRTADGFAILIGKNNLQNEKLNVPHGAAGGSVVSSEKRTRFSRHFTYLRTCGKCNGTCDRMRRSTCRLVQQRQKYK